MYMSALINFPEWAITRLGRLHGGVNICLLVSYRPLARGFPKGGDTKIELGFSMSQAGNSGDPSGGTPFGDA